MVEFQFSHIESMDLIGIVSQVLPVQTFSGKDGKEYRRYGFVVEQKDGTYTRKVCFGLLGDDKWDKMKDLVLVGNTVHVYFDLSSREYNGRWYTSCDAFKASLVEQASVSTPTPVRSEPKRVSGSSDGLPF